MSWEVHSLSSLSIRLKNLVCRNTLASWLKTGALKARFQQQHGRKGQSRHLLFTTQKLDQLLALLEEGYQERINRLTRTNAEAVRFRAMAQANALEILKSNQRAQARGQRQIREPDPCLNDDDARAISRLTLDPKNEPNTFTIPCGEQIYLKKKSKKEQHVQ
jgi:hypothetical protein